VPAKLLDGVRQEGGDLGNVPLELVDADGELGATATGSGESAGTFHWSGRMAVWSDTHASSRLRRYRRTTRMSDWNRRTDQTERAAGETRACFKHCFAPRKRLTADRRKTRRHAGHRQLCLLATSWSMSAAFDDRSSNFGEDIDLMCGVLDLDAGTLVYTTDAVVVGDMPANLTAMVKKWRQYGLATSLLRKYDYRGRRIDVAPICRWPH